VNLGRAEHQDFLGKSVFLVIAGGVESLVLVVCQDKAVRLDILHLAVNQEHLVILRFLERQARVDTLEIVVFLEPVDLVER